MNTKEHKMTAERSGYAAYYDNRHGGPWDRGSADSYYKRGFNPHYFVGDTYSTPKVEMEQMTRSQPTPQALSTMKRQVRKKIGAETNE